ncbi:hypothetical protein [Iodobacter fluviatilis]|uniref:Uncharacterized protein n=1 Tax=Iodobacter fluviatilis TaxID=537 RepID=A0A7G3GA82_9NEIS|nr:hypothetical protein [Iodobacter fluviatilis]QBC44430.1 hypothetical protein C1H71_13425 [Iodobacter fluviatilis]
MRGARAHTRDAQELNQTMNLRSIIKNTATPAQIARDTAISKKRLDWQLGAELKQATKEVWECRV